MLSSCSALRFSERDPRIISSAFDGAIFPSATAWSKACRASFMEFKKNGLSYTDSVSSFSQGLVYELIYMAWYLSERLH